jgi:hypothetical protein
MSTRTRTHGIAAFAAFRAAVTANIREHSRRLGAGAGRALPVVRRQPAEIDDPPPPSNAAASG